MWHEARDPDGGALRLFFFLELSVRSGDDALHTILGIPIGRRRDNQAPFR